MVQLRRTPIVENGFCAQAERGERSSRGGQYLRRSREQLRHRYAVAVRGRARPRRWRWRGAAARAAPPRPDVSRPRPIEPATAPADPKRALAGSDSSRPRRRALLPRKAGPPAKPRATLAGIAPTAASRNLPPRACPRPRSIDSLQPAVCRRLVRCRPVRALLGSAGEMVGIALSEDGSGRWPCGVRRIAATETGPRSGNRAADGRSLGVDATGRAGPRPGPHQQREKRMSVRFALTALSLHGDAAFKAAAAHADRGHRSPCSPRTRLVDLARGPPCRSRPVAIRVAAAR